MSAREMRSYGKNEAGVLEFDADLPGIEVPLKQRQAFFVGGGKSYVVTCTAVRKDFEKYSAKFDEMLKSFVVPLAK
ncbi:MAG: hypothetical protein QM775_29125 [Pirellulales bacterium]